MCYDAHMSHMDIPGNTTAVHLAYLGRRGENLRSPPPPPPPAQTQGMCIRPPGRALKTLAALCTLVQSASDGTCTCHDISPCYKYPDGQGLNPPRHW